MLKEVAHLAIQRLADNASGLLAEESGAEGSRGSRRTTSPAPLLMIAETVETDAMKTRSVKHWQFLAVTRPKTASPASLHRTRLSL